MSLWPEDEAPKKVRHKIEMVTLANLLMKESETQRWLIDRLLGHGCLSLVVGRPKTYKSHFVRQLIASVASGTDFLGRQCEARKVAYFALEEKASEVANHFRLLSPINTENVLIHAGPLKTNWVHALNIVVNESKPGLLVIDPLFRMIQVRDVCDYMDLTTAMTPLIEICRTTNTHIVMVHHAVKAKVGPDQELGILGSTAIFGSVDTAIFLRRQRCDYIGMSIRHRYAADEVEVSMKFDGLARTLQISDENSEDNLASEMLTVLSQHTNGLTESDLEDLTVGPTDSKRKVLRQLVGRSAVIRTGLGKRGTPYRYRAAVAGLDENT